MGFELQIEPRGRKEREVITFCFAGLNGKSKGLHPGGLGMDIEGIYKSGVLGLRGWGCLS